MQLADLVATSRAVGESSGRLQKVARLASLLEQARADEIEIAVAFLSGSLRQGRIGVGGASIRDARGVQPAGAATLQLRDVDRAFEDIRSIAGAGSITARTTRLRDLMARATADEQDFLTRLLFGELRQGALEGVLLEAVARAARVPAASVRRAAMLAGSLATVAVAALAAGGTALDAFIIQPFQPVQPMLADSAEGVDEALRDLGSASLEYKLDGARIQVHRSGDEVRVFTRNLRDVTKTVPEVVAAVCAVPARELILDGEAIALRPDGSPHPFQITMRRFGRTLEVERLRSELPMSPFFFDLLYLDGTALIDEPLSARVAALSRLTPVTLQVPRIVPASAADAGAFIARAEADGHEGVMAKALNGVYAAGRRGQTWLKVKRARSLDLVVLAVEWGSGRRRGMLSNLHLGARDAVRGGFVMLGKTFKGLTDPMLAWQTTKLLELEVARDSYTVYVRPELVVEIAFNDVQESPRYPGRLALRFARVKRYRTDKSAAQADTLDAVRDVYRQMTGLEPPVL
ncbi:MAG: ATP-dependent DNA ligase [Luteitalea sp.]|nr:ATP-dependent DNA ligase [Luteitalea sp.]